MHAAPRVSYTGLHEIQRHTGRVGTSASPRRAARPRRVLDRGGRRFPRRRSLDRAALGGRVPRPGRTGARRPAGPRSATEAHPHPGEGNPALVEREPDGAWVRDRAVDRPASGSLDPGGVRHPAPSEVPQHLASSPRILPAETRTRPPRTRPEGDRRVAGGRLAAHQKKARRPHARIALIDASGLLMTPLARRTWAPRGETPELVQKGGAREGLRRGSPVVVAPAGPAGPVLPDSARRLLR
jgi:hypothetical protein